VAELARVRVIFREACDSDHAIAVEYDTCEEICFLEILTHVGLHKGDDYM